MIAADSVSENQYSAVTSASTGPSAWTGPETIRAKPREIAAKTARLILITSYGNHPSGTTRLNSFRAALASPLEYPLR